MAVAAGELWEETRQKRPQERHRRPLLQWGGEHGTMDEPCHMSGDIFLNFVDGKKTWCKRRRGALAKPAKINRAIQEDWRSVAGAAGTKARRERAGCCPVRHNPQRSAAAGGSSPSGSRGGRRSQGVPSSSASCWQSRQRQAPGTASSRDRGISSPQSMHRRRPLQRRSPSSP